MSIIDSSRINGKVILAISEDISGTSTGTLWRYWWQYIVGISLGIMAFATLVYTR